MHACEFELCVMAKQSHDELGVLWLLPVTQVAQIAEKSFIIEESVQREVVQVCRIRETLNELKLRLEADLLALCIVHSR
jgi:hypothetical protein